MALTLLAVPFALTLFLVEDEWAPLLWADGGAGARELGRTERTWPCLVVAHEHWRADFAAARAGSYVDITLQQAVAAVNAWVDEIAEAT